MTFVLQSTHWVLAGKSKIKIPLKPYNDRGEGGAAWLSCAQLCLQLWIWKENSSLTGEMYLLARLLRDTKHYFINPEINLNLSLADFVKATVRPCLGELFGVHSG